MKKVIVTDIDDVVLQWEYPFHTWMELHGYLKVNDPNGYQHDVSKTYNLTVKKTVDLVKAFNDSAAIGFLPPFRDSQYYIKLLHEKHQYQFVAVTAASSDEYAKKLRIRNLKKLFGDNTFIEYHILPLGADKRSILKSLYAKYGPTYWIEDSPEHASAGQEIGYKSMLMLHGRNKIDADRFIAVPNWETIYNTILADQRDSWGQPTWQITQTPESSEDVWSDLQVIDNKGFKPT